MGRTKIRVPGMPIIQLGTFLGASVVKIPRSSFIFVPIYF